PATGAPLFKSITVPVTWPMSEASFEWLLFASAGRGEGAIRTGEGAARCAGRALTLNSTITMPHAARLEAILRRIIGVVSLLFLGLRWWPRCFAAVLFCLGCSFFAL